MSARGGSGDDMLQLVLDDDTVRRLREVAEDRGIEVELVIVRLLQRASWHAHELLDAEDAAPPMSGRWAARRRR